MINRRETDVTATRLGRFVLIRLLPNVMDHKFLDLRQLAWLDIFDRSRGELFDKASDIFNENVVSSDHDLVLAHLRRGFHIRASIRRSIEHSCLSGGLFRARFFFFL